MMDDGSISKYIMEHLPGIEGDDHLKNEISNKIGVKY